jgi:hypothetical protein
MAANTRGIPELAAAMLAAGLVWPAGTNQGRP